MEKVYKLKKELTNGPRKFLNEKIIILDKNKRKKAIHLLTDFLKRF